MADANTDERTLTITQESGEDKTYSVADMEDEEQNIYAKLQVLANEENTLKANAEFRLEQIGILKQNYVGALASMLNGGKELSEQGVQSEAKGNKARGVQGGNSANAEH